MKLGGVIQYCPLEGLSVQFVSYILQFMNLCLSPADQCPPGKEEV